jgi:hypothetical protein
MSSVDPTGLGSMDDEINGLFGVPRFNRLNLPMTGGAEMGGGGGGYGGGGGEIPWAKEPPAAWQAAAGAETRAEAKVDAVSRAAPEKAPLPNGGDGAPHDGEAHNQAIDDRIGQLKQDPTVTNLRKNQQQADVNGNKASTNRPDIQYDRDSVHNVEEYDRRAKSSNAHGVTIKKNDPNASVQLKILLN